MGTYDGCWKEKKIWSELDDNNHIMQQMSLEQSGLMAIYSTSINSKVSGQSFWVWEVKPIWKCIKPTFFLMSSRGQLHKFAKVRLYERLWENDADSHLIYYVSKQFPNDSIMWIL